MTRRALVGAGWLVTLGSAALEVLCALGVSRPVALDWLWAYVPVLFLPAWLVLIAALVFGRRALFVAALAVVAGHLALVLPAITGGPEAPPPDATRFRLVTANVAYFNPTIELLLSEVGSTDADIVLLQEVRPRIVPMIEEILGDDYPYVVVLPHPEAFGYAVLSRFPLRDEVVLGVGDLPMLAVTAEIGGRDVRLWNVHTRSPTELRRRFLRDEQLDELVSLRRFERGPLIAAGDYNATIWHDELRTLADTDLRDAAGVVGEGLRGTWKGAPLGIDAPIDHVLVSSELGVTDVGVGAGPGSDHRPVVADLWVSAG